MSGSRVNVTLSADADLVRRTREYATRHGTTLNQLVRDHMETLTGRLSAAEAAEAFAEVARTSPGCSPEGYRFNRDDTHTRQR